MFFPPILTKLISGVWGYVAAAVVAGAAVFFVTHYIDAAVYGKQIADGKTQLANFKAASASAALTQLTGFIDKLHTSENDYTATLQTINNQYVSIQKGLSDAIAKKPLPANCKPDAGRLRVLTDAVTAANQSTGTKP